VRESVPAHSPVSAKLRLGWEEIDDIDENAAMAAEGGAAWITVHARTRTQGYAPPVYWHPIQRVRESLSIPVIANGDIWDLDDFRQCREETGCIHFMIGRGALANPKLPYQVAHALGIGPEPSDEPTDWPRLLMQLVGWTEHFQDRVSARSLMRLKQWLKLAANHGEFRDFDLVKQSQTVEEFFLNLSFPFEVGARPAPEVSIRSTATAS
jgi:tRNA-dihydrouridine synthase C